MPRTQVSISPTKPSIPAWYARFKELRALGVPVAVICRDHIKQPRSTVYAKLSELSKAKGDAA